MNIIRRLLRQDPPIVDPNVGLTEADDLDLDTILARLDPDPYLLMLMSGQDDEDDTANFDLIEQEYDR